jgi:hypothetical protein
MNLVVADHHHDSDAGVYRLVIGEIVEREQNVVDENGAFVLDENGQPETETISEIVPLEDVVFADDDERWRQMDPQALAAAQRKLVTHALAGRVTSAPASAAPAVVQLPGVGDPLT